MNVVRERVRHVQYGPGEVTGQTETSVTVAFDDGSGVRRFMYPAAFGTFLELCDEGARGMMEEELGELRAAEETERQKRAEAAEARRLEEVQAVLQQKRAAAKRRTAVKKVKEQT